MVAMSDDDELPCPRPPRSQPYRPLRRLPQSAAEDGPCTGKTEATDDLAWLSLLELVLDDEAFPRRR